MKKIAFILIITTTLFTCNNDDDSEPEIELSGNWELTQMSGSIPNSTTTGADMEWQETYTLNIDGTFEKSRSRNELTTKASGTYSLVDSASEIVIAFVFNEQNTLIGNCYSNLTEQMILESENIISNTWQACDGPRLRYERID